MMFINLIVVLVYIMLAVFSRKNHSKYKGNIFKSIADTIYWKTESRFCYDGIKRSIRKVRTVSPKGLEQLARKHIVDSLALALSVFFIFNLISIMAFIKENSVSDNANVIVREGYQGNVKEEILYLEYAGEETAYAIDVSQLLYTEQEFFELTDKMFADLHYDILGNNESMEKITGNLDLPDKSEDGVFSIKWKSNSPHILSSHGKINIENIKEQTKVELEATIKYLDYKNSYNYSLVVWPYEENVGNNEIGNVAEILDGLEKEKRNEKYFEVPEEIDGVKVSVAKNSRNKASVIFLIGCLISIILLFLNKSKLDEQGKVRDSMLMEQYPVFVNKLWLLLGTGMTIKSCFLQIADETEMECVLTRELEYTINQIDSGIDEAFAYEELGQRLEIGCYRRLMSQVSQNLRMGTRDLLKLMEEEVRTSLESKKEHIRRKGEEASTKLLFPMIILLATVMIIVILPAMVSF